MTGIRGISRLNELDAPALLTFLDRETDIPASIPVTKLPVSAGISGQRGMLTVPSFTQPGETILITGELDLSAALPADRRGVHMSRMIEACDRLNGREWDSLSDFLNALTSEVAVGQKLADATVSLHGVTTAHRRTPVTNRRSPDLFHIEAQSDIGGSNGKCLLGLGADIMTACPCTQAYSRYSTIDLLISKLGVDAANEFGFANPTFTHSQRGRVWLRCDVQNTQVGLEQMYEAIDSAAHLTFELLKRPDEHALVQKSHERPQFTEDVVREVAGNFVQKNLSNLHPEARVKVSCRNIESIHSHDAYSELSLTVEQIAGELGQ